MTNTKEKKKIVVLGAGCAGLAAAWRLAKNGFDVEVFEGSNRVGGLAGGVEINGNVYEYGPHAFHTTDPEILNDIKAIMGDDLIEYKRTIKIKFLGNYFAYPLTIHEVIAKLPISTVFKAFGSFVWHAIAGWFWKPKVENSETVLVRYYGKILYKLFFEDYIVRVWGIPPREFSPNFARQRIPRLDFIKIFERIMGPIKNRFRKKINTKQYVEKVEGKLYTTKRGFSLITERMAVAIRAKGGKINMNCVVKKITREENVFHSVIVEDTHGQNSEIEFDGLVTTLPINEAILMTEPPFPHTVLSAAEKLKFRALVLVGLVVRRPKVLMTSFMYFREHSFNRLTDLSQFGFEVKPKGSTIVVGEISCGVNDEYWQNEDFAREAVIQDLVRESILTRDEIIGAHVFKAKHAYPIYTLHYEAALELLLRTIDNSANGETAGRQGRFQYINTHVAMKMGYEAAEKLSRKMLILSPPSIVKTTEAARSSQ